MGESRVNTPFTFAGCFISQPCWQMCARVHGGAEEGGRTQHKMRHPPLCPTFLLILGIGRHGNHGCKCLYAFLFWGEGGGTHIIPAGLR